MRIGILLLVVCLFAIAGCGESPMGPKDQATDSSGENPVPIQKTGEEQRSENHQPVIKKMIAESDVIGVGELTKITVEAEDPDGDPLNYS